MKKIFFGIFLAVVSVALVQVGCDQKATPAGAAVPSINPAPSFSTLYSNTNGPRGLATDGSGNVYIANRYNGTIIKVNSRGVGSVVASGITNPRGLAVDQNGTIFVNCGNSGRILTVVNGTKSTFLPNYYHVIGLAINNGTLYFTSAKGGGSNTLYSVSTSGGTVTTVTAGFNRPHGVGVDNSGNVFVADSSNNKIVKVVGGVKSNFATGLSHPWGIAVDVNGNVYTTESNGNLDRFTPAGVKSLVTTYGWPTGVAVNTIGNTVYVTDSNNNKINQVTYIYP